MWENVITEPGRVRTYRNDTSGKALPFSCILRKYENNLGYLLTQISRDLKGGAGVKVVLDEFAKFEPVSTECQLWGFYLDPNHPDYTKLTQKQKERLLEPREGIIFKVEDSMAGDHGIEHSWSALIDSTFSSPSYQQPIVFDLSKLRPSGSVNSTGLIASGPVSFLEIYFAIENHLKNADIGSLIQLLGTQNDVIRRGGFKRGIICTSLHYKSPSIWDYIKQPSADVPGGHRKAYRIDTGLLDQELLNAIAQSSESEGAFLEKIKGNELYANVCEGISIKPNGTCLITRINLAQVKTFKDLPSIFREATEQICSLHIDWRRNNPTAAARVASEQNDPQVAIDLLGFASAIAQWGITYEQMRDALKRFNDDAPGARTTLADDFVYWLAKAYQASQETADELSVRLDIPKFQRLHTIEPSQRHFLDCQDSEGYTVTRSVHPPFDKRLSRISETEKITYIQHNPKVETAGDIGPDLWESFFCELKRFIDQTGRSHGYMSFDSYKLITADWIRWFLEESPLESLYYPEASRYNNYYLTKSIEEVSLGIEEDCSVCAE